jgi:proteasome lid subunit RPN8/RPN11
MERTEKKVVLGKLVEVDVPISPSEPDELPNAFAVHCTEELSAKMMDYAVRFKHTEVFGLLLGEVFHTPTGRLRTIVRDFVPAERLQASTATFVEVSAEELIRMDQKCEPLMAGNALLRIGWFHTHPGHGIFMSPTDRDNHALYSKPWQIALVLDPIRKTFGFFGGSSCEPVPHYSTLSSRTSDTRVDRESPLIKYRHWLLVFLLFQLALGFFTWLGYHKASVAFRYALDCGNRVHRLETDRKQLQERSNLSGASTNSGH